MGTIKLENKRLNIRIKDMFLSMEVEYPEYIKEKLPENLHRVSVDEHKITVFYGDYLLPIDGWDIVANGSLYDPTEITCDGHLLRVKGANAMLFFYLNDHPFSPEDIGAKQSAQFLSDAQLTNLCLGQQPYSDEVNGWSLVVTGNKNGNEWNEGFRGIKFNLFIDETKEAQKCE